MSILFFVSKESENAARFAFGVTAYNRKGFPAQRLFIRAVTSRLSAAEATLRNPSPRKGEVFLKAVDVDEL